MLISRNILQLKNFYDMSESFILFISLLGLVWGVLCLVLFFKVWGMTNDVEEIKELLKGNLRRNSNAPQQEVAKCDAPEEKPQFAEETGENKGAASLGLIPIFISCIILVVVILAVIFLNVK